MTIHVNLIENVYKIATKLVSQWRELVYESRQKILNIPTPAHRRKGTMIELYKLTIQYYDSSWSDRLLEPGSPEDIRTNSCQKTRSESRRNWFTVRAAKKLEQSAEEVISCPNHNILTRKARGWPPHTHMRCGLARCSWSQRQRLSTKEPDLNWPDIGCTLIKVNML